MARRRRNPMEEIMLFENPRWPSRRRRARRNPKGLGGIMPSSIRGFLPVGITEVVAGGASLIAVSMLPGMIIKTPDTTAKKVGKFALAIVTAGVCGMVAKSINPAAQKAAIVGGLAGVVVQGLSSVTGVTIGNSRSLPFGGFPQLQRPGMGYAANQPARSEESAIICNVT